MQPKLIEIFQSIADIHATTKTEQIREIVPIEKWLENGFYCGPDGLLLYDFWKQEITEFIHSGQPEWVLFGSLGSGKCITGNNRVMTSEGYIKIEDLAPSEVDGFTPLEVKVDDTHSSDYFYKDSTQQEVVRVYSDRIDLSGTKDHPIKVLTPDGVQLKKLGELKNGVRVALDTQVPVLFNNRTTRPEEFKDLTEGEFGHATGTLSLGESLEMEKLSEWFFKSNKDFIRGFLLGLLRPGQRHYEIASQSKGLIKSIQELSNILSIYPRFKVKSMKGYINYFGLEFTEVEFNRLTNPTQAPKTRFVFTECKVEIIKKSVNVYDLSVPVTHQFYAGGVINHNTTAAAFALFRKIYELSCFSPIPGIYNLMRSTILWFVYFSVSLTQAKRTGYGRIMAIADTIPYFNKYFIRDKNVISSLVYPSMTVTYGSDVGHQIGMDLFGTFLDEGDFYKSVVSPKDVEVLSKSKILYEATLRRRKTRFNIKGEDNGLSLLISSPSYQSPFVEERIQKLNSSGKGFVTIVEGLKVNAAKFSADDKFHVYLGSEMFDPKVIQNRDDLVELLEGLSIEYDKKAGSIELFDQFADRLELEAVPVDFLDDFLDDIVASIQDILGKSLRGSVGFVTERSLNKATTSMLKRMFVKDIISISTKRSDRIEDFFIDTPNYDREVPRCIHIDQSITTDRTGLACSVHIGCSMRGGLDPHVATEWMLSLSPPSVGEIPILRVAEFIVHLRDLGYNIAFVSLDSFQSRSSLQYLESEGINCGLVSVDRTDEEYLFLKGLIIADKYICPANSIFKRELLNLVWDKRKRKIDHRPGQSKDLSDAVVGSVINVFNYGQNYLPTMFIGSTGGEDETIADQVLNESLWDEVE